MDLPEEQTCSLHGWAKPLPSFCSQTCALFILLVFHFIWTISREPVNCMADTGQAKENISNAMSAAGWKCWSKVGVFPLGLQDMSEDEGALAAWVCTHEAQTCSVWFHLWEVPEDAPGRASLSFPTLSPVHCLNKSWLNCGFIVYLPPCFTSVLWIWETNVQGVFFTRSICLSPWGFRREKWCPLHHCTVLMVLNSCFAFHSHSKEKYSSLIKKSDLMYLLLMATYLSDLQPFKVQKQLKQHKLCS